MKTANKKSSRSNRTSNKPVSKTIKRNFEDEEGGAIYWKRMHTLENLHSHLAKEIPTTTSEKTGTPINSIGFNITLNDDKDFSTEHLKIINSTHLKVFGDEKDTTKTYLVDYGLPIAPGDRIAVFTKDGKGKIGSFKQYLKPEGHQSVVIVGDASYEIDQVESMGRITGYFAYHPF